MSNDYHYPENAWAESLIDPSEGLLVQAGEYEEREELRSQGRMMDDSETEDCEAAQDRVRSLARLDDLPQDDLS